MRNWLLGIFLISSIARAESLYDLKVGSTWTYQVEGGSSDTVTNSITGMQQIQGKIWYKLVEYGDTFWVRNDDSGQIEAANFFDSEPTPQDEPEEVLIYKYPAKAGETWDADGTPITYKGLSTVTVPAGTFDCHEYLIDMGPGFYSRSCITAGIGVIYNEAVLEKGVKQVSRLVAYK